MSIFASRTQKEIPLPHDPPHVVTIQKLTGRHLERAKQESQFESVEFFRRLGGAAFQKELAALGDEKKQAEEGKKAQQDPLTTVDRATVLKHGVVSWTYPDAVTAATLDDLDEATSDLLAREVMRLTKPDLFQTESEVEAAQKND